MPVLTLEQANAQAVATQNAIPSGAAVQSSSPLSPSTSLKTRQATGNFSVPVVPPEGVDQPALNSEDLYDGRYNFGQLQGNGITVSQTSPGIYTYHKVTSHSWVGGAVAPAFDGSAYDYVTLEARGLIGGSSSFVFEVKNNFDYILRPTVSLQGTGWYTVQFFFPKNSAPVNFIAFSNPTGDFQIRDLRFSDAPVFTGVTPVKVVQTSSAVSNALDYQLAYTLNGVFFQEAVLLKEGNNTVTRAWVNASGKKASYSFSILADTVRPTGSININSSALYTASQTVTLNISGKDKSSGIGAMSFSADGTNWTAPVAYATSKTFTLPAGDGTKTVYVKYFDKAGNASVIYSKSIVLDTTPPAGEVNINSGEAYTSLRNVTLSLSAADGGSGLAKMSFSTNGTTWTTAETYAASKTFTLPSGDGNKTVYAKYYDKAGNVSTVYSKSIILDTVAPVGTVKVNGGVVYINQAAVTLDLSASDAGSGLSQMCFSTNGTTWTTAENYAATKAWTFATGDGAKKVYVKFQDKAGKWSAAVSVTVTLDTVAPTGSININSGAVYGSSQTVTLNLSGTDSRSGISTMSFSTDGTNWTAPGAYAASKTFTLPAGDGTKTVFVKYFDKAGNVSAVYSKSIILDTLPPTGAVAVNGGTAFINQTAAILDLSATDAGSGLSKMSFSTNGTTWTTAENYAATKAWTFANGDGAKTVYAKFQDKTGKWSAVASVTVLLDTVKPSGSIGINSGAVYTNSTAVTLNLSATDGASGVATMSFSTDNVTWTAVEAYAASRSFTFPVGDGVKTVYVRYYDKAGNFSATLSKSITLDTAVPAGSININSGVLYANSTAVTLNLSATDSGSGINAMSFSTDNVNWGSSEAYTTSKTYALPTGDGSKTVYVKYFDVAGNVSLVYSKSIILDTLPPTGTITVNSGAQFITQTAVTLDLSAADAGSGLDKMSFSSDNVTWTTAEAYAATRSWAFSSGDGNKTVSVKFSDASGGWSSPVSVQVLLDTTAPTGEISINNNAAYTPSSLVTLNLYYIWDIGSGVDRMRFSADGGANWSAWEAFSASRSFTLPEGTGTRQVQCQLRDRAGLVSEVFSDIIRVGEPPAWIPAASNANFALRLNPTENGFSYIEYKNLATGSEAQVPFPVYGGVQDFDMSEDGTTVSFHLPGSNSLYSYRPRTSVDLLSSYAMFTMSNANVSLQFITQIKSVWTGVYQVSVTAFQVVGQNVSTTMLFSETGISSWPNFAPRAISSDGLTAVFERFYSGQAVPELCVLHGGSVAAFPMTEYENFRFTHFPDLGEVIEVIYKDGHSEYYDPATLQREYPSQSEVVVAGVVYNQSAITQLPLLDGTTPPELTWGTGTANGTFDGWGMMSQDSSRDFRLSYDLTDNDDYVFAEVDARYVIYGPLPNGERWTAMNLSSGLVLAANGPAGKKIKIEVVDDQARRAAYYLDLTGVKLNYALNFTGMGIDVAHVQKIIFTADKEHMGARGRVIIETKGLEFVPTLGPQIEGQAYDSNAITLLPTNPSVSSGVGSWGGTANGTVICDPTSSRDFTMRYTLADNDDYVFTRVGNGSFDAQEVWTGTTMDLSAGLIFAANGPAGRQLAVKVVDDLGNEGLLDLILTGSKQNYMLPAGLMNIDVTHVAQIMFMADQANMGVSGQVAFELSGLNYIPPVPPGWIPAVSNTNYSFRVVQDASGYRLELRYNPGGGITILSTGTGDTPDTFDVTPDGSKVIFERDGNAYVQRIGEPWTTVTVAGDLKQILYYNDYVMLKTDRTYPSGTVIRTSTGIRIGTFNPEFISTFFLTLVTPGTGFYRNDSLSLAVQPEYDQTSGQYYALIYSLYGGNDYSSSVSAASLGQEAPGTAGGAFTLVDALAAPNGQTVLAIGVDSSTFNKTFLVNQHITFDGAAIAVTYQNNVAIYTVRDNDGSTRTVRFDLDKLEIVPELPVVELVQPVITQTPNAANQWTLKLDQAMRGVRYEIQYDAGSGVWQTAGTFIADSYGEVSWQDSAQNRGSVVYRAVPREITTAADLLTQINMLYLDADFGLVESTHEYPLEGWLQRRITQPSNFGFYANLLATIASGDLVTSTISKAEAIRRLDVMITQLLADQRRLGHHGLLPWLGFYNGDWQRMDDLYGRQVSFEDNTNMTAGLAVTYGALLDASLAGNATVHAAGGILDKIDAFIENQREGYVAMYNEANQTFARTMVIADDHLEGTVDLFGAESMGTLLFLILQYGAAFPASVYQKLYFSTSSYTMQDGSTRTVVEPFSGAFQMYWPALVLPEADNPDLRSMLETYTDVQLDYAQRNNQPGILSASYDVGSYDLLSRYINAFSWQGDAVRTSRGTDGSYHLTAASTNGIGVVFTDDSKYVFEGSSMQIRYSSQTAVPNAKLEFKQKIDGVLTTVCVQDLALENTGGEVRTLLLQLPENGVLGDLSEVVFATSEGSGPLDLTFYNVGIDRIQYNFSLGINEIAMNGVSETTPSTYNLGAAYMFRPAGVEVLLKKLIADHPELITDHGLWEGLNMTTGKVVKEQVFNNVLSFTLGMVGTGGASMTRYLEDKGLTAKLQSIWDPQIPISLTSGTSGNFEWNGFKATAWHVSDAVRASDRELHITYESSTPITGVKLDLKHVNSSEPAYSVQFDLPATGSTAGEYVITIPGSYLYWYITDAVVLFPEARGFPNATITGMTIAPANDTVPPAVMLDAGTPSLIKMKTLTVSYAADGVAKTKLFEGLVEGENTLTFIEKDLAGNQTTVNWNVTVDTIAPVVVLDTETPTWIVSSSIVVGYTLDGVFKLKTFTNLSQGDNQLTILETDPAGNQTAVNFSVRYSSPGTDFLKGQITTFALNGGHAAAAWDSGILHVTSSNFKGVGVAAIMPRTSINVREIQISYSSLTPVPNARIEYKMRDSSGHLVVVKTQYLNLQNTRGAVRTVTPDLIFSGYPPIDEIVFVTDGTGASTLDMTFYGFAGF
ncbi:MAG: Ig-like domain repeat protein [Candidatus Omnitrophota bacterium]